MAKEYISCPFCGQDDFDLYGLKCHLTGEGMLFYTGCEEFENMTEIKQAQIDAEDDE